MSPPGSTTPPRTHVAVMDLPPPEPKRGFPAALITVLVAIGMVAVLAVLYLYVLPNKNTVATNGPAAQSQASSAQIATPLKPVHPLAKHLEITGLRLTDDDRQRTQVQFVIVNHSAADLPPLNMQITLKEAGGKIIYEFPFAVPSLGPYESKDFTTPLKTQLKGYELPDWQFLRAAFEISSAQ
jgi:hypothetical protein